MLIRFYLCLLVVATVVSTLALLAMRFEPRGIDAAMVEQTAVALDVLAWALMVGGASLIGLVPLARLRLRARR